MIKLTIVATSYKSAKYLEIFFRNILELENLGEIKVILVSNMPSIQETEIIRKYSRQYENIFRIIYLDNLETIAQSLNRGFKIADTEYISYMDVDDFRTPNSFILQRECLKVNSKIDFTYGDFIQVKKQGESRGKLINTPEFESNFFTRGCYVSPTHFYRRSLFDKIGYWDEQFKSGGDFEFQARAAAAGVRFKKTDGLMLYYTKEKNSSSASSNILQPLEATVIGLRYGIFDKIDYRYYDRATKYHIHEIKDGNKWIPVSNIIPNYDEFIEERKYLLPVGKRNHFLNMVKHNLKLPLKMILRPRSFYRNYFAGKKQKDLNVINI